MEPVTIRDAGGGGDCFYYSLYEALKESKSIDSTCTFLDLPKTKSAFVAEFRVLISQNAEEDLRRMLSHLKTLDDLTIAMQIEEMSNEFQEILQFENIQQIPEKVLIGQLQEAMATRQVFVSEIEVTAARRILQCLPKPINLEIFHNPCTEMLNQKNRIALLNIDTLHYRWFSFDSMCLSEIRRRKREADDEEEWHPKKRKQKSAKTARLKSRGCLKTV